MIQRKGRKGTAVLAVLLLLLLALAACGQDPGSSSAVPEEAEPTGDIVILYTSDVHCAIDEGFGYPGLWQVKHTLEQNGDAVLLVDNGDAVQGDVAGIVTKGEAIIDLMNESGYNVAIPGNHEFDYGMEQFFALTEKAEFPYISCNFTRDGELVFDPYLILEAGGKKIAFVGITTPLTLTSSTPKFFQNEEGEFIYGFLQDDTGQKLIRALQTAVDEARADGADYVVVLGHMGNDAADAPYDYATLIENTTGIDAFLDGHSHDTDQVEMKDKDGKTVLRSACGTKMEGIGWLRISGEDGSLSCGLYLWENEDSVAGLLGIENPLTDKVQAVNAQLDEELDQVIGTTPYDLTIHDPEAKTEDGAPVRIVRVAETNLADLVADAYRAAGDTEIGVAGAGSVREDLPKGDITFRDVLAVNPYNNYLCVAEVTGRQILDALEWGVHLMPNEHGGLLQVSGLTYEVDPTIPSSCTQDADGMFTGVSGPYRVTSVLVDGKPLEMEKTYTITSTDYVLKNHGDGFTMFDGAKILQDDFIVDNQALVNYISEDMKGTGSETYKDPYGEGRITVPETGE